MAINFNNVTYPGGYWGEDDGPASASFKIDQVYTYGVTVNGTVNAVGDQVTLTYGADAPAGYAGTTITLTASQYDNNNQIEFTSTSIPPGETTAQTYRYVLSNTQIHGKYLPGTTTTDPNRTTFTADGDNTPTDYNVAAAPCFATGTRIRVVRDGVPADIAVEALAVGDQAVTASGAIRPIVWIGHRVIDCSRHPVPANVKPVHIAAHAFGDNRPARELVVSPGHAICVDLMGEVLVPAGALVNGTTIVQHDVDEVTYWHVELESHDILLSENMPTESYLEMGNRGFFMEADVVDLAAGPDVASSQRTHADFCRPFVDGGPVLEAVRLLLRRRAEAIGWRSTDALEMHLLVDGQRLDPVVRDLTARFHVPATAKDVWLVSPTARPRDSVGGSDTRDLGLYIGGLRVDDGFTARDVAIDDPLLCIGFHAVENGARRWTAARARLPAALWDGCEGDFYLRIELAGRPVPRWTSPALEAMSVERPRLAIVA